MEHDFIDLSIKITNRGLETNVKVDGKMLDLISKEKHIDEDLLAVKIAKECACFMDKLEELLK